MKTYKFNINLYSKIALIKAAYNFTDIAYVHLDMCGNYYHVTLTPKNPAESVDGEQFANEMLAQSVRHEIYIQTKNIRELMFARALATSVIETVNHVNEKPANEFDENIILKDWFLEK